MRRSVMAVALAFAVLVAGACGSGDGSTERSSSAPAPPDSAFAGSVERFYDPPEPLPEGPAGTIIRHQPVNETAGRVTWRIMYLSAGASGRPQPATGTVTFPTEAAPDEGWPVVANAPGTVGLHTSCAPSRNSDPAATHGVTGVGVRTDYVGMVSGQLQRYLSGPAEAHSMIDAVRAARTIPQAGAGRRWVAVGFSQGGHAALFADQLAGSYAPELDLVGTVAGAPAIELVDRYDAPGNNIPLVAQLMALVALAADHPDLDLDRLLTPTARERLEVVRTGCLPDVLVAFAGDNADDVFAEDPGDADPVEALLTRSEPDPSAGTGPLLVYVGTADNIVDPDAVTRFHRRRCAATDAPATLVTVPGADHGTVGGPVQAEVEAWIAGRLAGQATPDDCDTG